MLYFSIEMVNLKPISPLYLIKKKISRFVLSYVIAYVIRIFEKVHCTKSSTM